MATLTVLMGCPGAGKTTWARTHTAGAVVLTTDPLRTEPRLRSPAATAAFLARLQGQAERTLHDGLDAIIDACNVHARERARWLKIAQQAHATTRLVTVHAPYRALIDVQRGREHSVTEPRMARYQEAFVHALQQVRRESWGSIEHVHRAGGWEYSEPQPKRVSNW